MLTERELGSLLAGFQRQAFRRYLTGEPDDYSWHRSWTDMLRRDHESGKSWRRVRIVSFPPSAWTRYGVEVARLSMAAGEDIRYLRRDVADRIGLAPYDSWLLDDEQLIRLHFHDGDNTFRGAELMADAGTVLGHVRWRDFAWRLAQTLEEFAASIRCTGRDR